MNALMIVLFLATIVLAMETLNYVPLKPNDRNEIGDVKREFLQTKVKTENEAATPEVSVNEKPFAEQLAAFEITCAKEDLLEDYQNENLKVGDSEYRLVETLIYVPVKPSDRNEVGADEFKREFLQTKLKTEDDEATERTAEVSVNEKQIEAFDKKLVLTGWKYSASKNLPAFEIICAKNDLREDYKNENVKVGDSEYRLVDCSICLYPCRNARFYCEAQHVFCEGCLQKNEEIGSKGCPNCRGVHYGGELTTLGKIAHSTVGKALQAILVILFTVFAMLSYNHFLISPFLPFFNVTVDFIVYIVGLFTLFTVRAVIFFIFHSFVSKKFLLPILNFIQPYNLTSARHYRIMFVSRVLYWFALIVYVRSLFFL